MRHHVIALAAASLFIACDQGSSTHGPELSIAVAPLTLPGVGRVCYDVAVENAAESLVWSKGLVGVASADGDVETICSDTFGGAGGGIAYVGPCDADQPEHTVTVWVDTIEDEDGNALDDWKDPCPNGCSQTATCEENADTLVSFDLVVMRSAAQGFFDVAVTFDDIFCSAKVDCTYDAAGDEPIELLFRPDGGRDQTAVIGFACTAGADAPGTVLHVNAPRVVCGAPASGNVLSTVPLVASRNGDVLGYLVRQTPMAVQLVPSLWKHTGPHAWAESVPLPTGALNSGVILTHLGDDRAAGVLFDIPQDGSTPPQNPPQWASVWKLQGGTWILERSEPVVPIDGGLAVYPVGYEPTTQIELLADNATGLPSAYWDLSQPGSTPMFFADVNGQTYGPGVCEASDFGGHIAVGKCSTDAIPVVWDLQTGVATPLEILFPAANDGAPYVSGYAVLSDGSIIAPVGTDEHNVLQHWTNNAGTWSATQVGDDFGTNALDMIYSRGDYFALQSGSDTRIFHYVAGSEPTMWDPSLAVGEGEQLALRNIGLSANGTAFVYGERFDVNGFVTPVAAVLIDGFDLDLVPLPLPGEASTESFQNIDVVGRNGDAVWLAGIRGNSALEATTVIWSLVPSTNGIAVDWRIIAPEDGTLTDLTRPALDPTYEATALTAIYAPTPQSGYGFGIEPFAGGEPGDRSSGTPLENAGGTGGDLTAVTLNPDIAGNAWTSDPDDTDPVWQYAVYQGAEALLCDGQPCNKLYWNMSVGFEPTAKSCKLYFEASAGGADDFDGGMTRDGAVYPYIDVAVDLTDASGAMVCRQNPLDGENSDVVSTYSAEPKQFCWSYDGSSVVHEAGCAD